MTTAAKGGGRTEATRDSDSEALEQLSTAAIIRDLATDIKEVATAELEAAKLEIKSELGQLKRQLLVASATAIVASLGVLMLVFAASRGIQLAIGVDIGFAMAMTGGVLLVLAGVGWAVARRTKSADLIPEESLENLKEDGQWLTDQVQSALK